MDDAHQLRVPTQTGGKGRKTQTAHIALTLVDCYLQQTSDLPKSDFQLAGAAAVFIAAKLEEFEPLSSQQFSIATKERYKPAEIREMELRICQVFRV